MSKSLRNWIIVLAIGFVIWVCPTPQGLTPNAWHLFAVFAATIAGFILQPISMGAVAFIALTFCAITGVLKTGQALMGFGNGTIWLIVCAFFLSRAFIKTGFGRRIAFPGRTHQKLSNEPRYRSPFIGDLTRGTF